MQLEPPPGESPSQKVVGPSMVLDHDCHNNIYEYCCRGTHSSAALMALDISASSFFGMVAAREAPARRRVPTREISMVDTLLRAKEIFNRNRIRYLLCGMY